MPTPDFCTLEELAGVFRGCKAEIVSEWQVQAAELLKDLELDQPTITDHIPDVVDEIIRDLAYGREGALSAEHTRGSPPVHGVQRVYDGLDVGEVVTEYNLLRVTFITIAERHGLYLVGEAMHIINRRIDEAVRMAVMAFAAQQALLRKEQEDQHLAFIAHDLRTPLNAVALLMEEIKMCLDEKARSETAEAFTIVSRNLLRVEGMAKRVLEISLQPQLVGSAFHPERRVFELWPLVQRLVLDLRAVATRNSIEVVNEVPRSLTIYADAGLISQVFQNLLDNAFKYAAQGRVTVSAAEATGLVNCVVHDSGAGIPLDLLESVFDKLATDPEKGGTGLGLVIVKQIVEAHGGTVSAESIHGAGATFTFTLPAAP